ncbi:super killer protein 3, partial [Candidatus Hakubella thermalkaliphila]
YGVIGRYDQSIKELKRAIELNPHDGGIYYNLALTYKNKGMVEEAIIEYEKAIQFDPDLMEARYNLGMIYENRGEKEKAMEAWKGYLELVAHKDNRAKEIREHLRGPNEHESR